jgi:hypothetical protein
MMDDMAKLERLGRAVDDALGPGPDDARLAEQRKALVATVPRGAKRAWMPWLAASAVAACALLAILVARNHEDRGSLGFRTDKGRMVFEGGSEIAIVEDAAVRVAEAGARRVRIDLERGRIEARIAGNGERQWLVEAGPYEVAVVGTVFAVSWEPASGAFDVGVTRGVVRVHGPGLDGQGVRLAAGRSLHVDGGNGPAIAAREEPAKIPATDVIATAALGVTAVSREARARSSAIGAGAIRPSEPPKWKELFEKGDYSGAMAAAEAAGLDEMLATADLDDLTKLADAARYARKGGDATRILVAVRARFAGSERSRIAAFLLGRVSMEIEGSPRDARRWFETYLAEDPDGPLAEEALGRLIDARKEAGARAGAREAATLYLTRHPDGVFADLARATLRE